MFRMINRIVRDEDEAQSILQETFLQAYQRMGTFRGESKVSTWLFAIGLNLARASLRKKKRFDTLDEAGIDRLQPVFKAGMPTQRAADWNPEKLAELSERRELVREAIQQLPEDYAMVVTLRDIDEMSTTEVAEMLNISEGAVRVRLHRARQALRKLLEKYIVA